MVHTKDLCSACIGWRLRLGNTGFPPETCGEDERGDASVRGESGDCCNGAGSAASFLAVRWSRFESYFKPGPESKQKRVGAERRNHGFPAGSGEVLDRPATQCYLLIMIKRLRESPGGMAERLKAAVLKTVVPLAAGPWVRILLPPPDEMEYPERWPSRLKALAC